MISDLTILYYVRMYAVTSWEVYAAHVRQCETYACSQCDILESWGGTSTQIMLLKKGNTSELWL